MSFILDALKKSETERQQQAGAEFSDVPSKPRESHAKWQTKKPLKHQNVRVLSQVF